jgi:5-methylthioadenosine/S-adenosylhomocysteine deaminase
LQLSTLAGARALGLDSQIGSLEVGKLANLAIVPLGGFSATDPHELLLASETGPTQTWWRGRRVAVAHWAT